MTEQEKREKKAHLLREIYFDLKGGERDAQDGVFHRQDQGSSTLSKDIIKCRRCGRTLKDKTSIKRGFGPVCWQRLQEEDNHGQKNRTETN